MSSAGQDLVTIDGPAGSGKSTTARAVADRLGWRYLDSGALYRAITFALLRSGHPRARWPRLSRDDLDRLEVSTGWHDRSLRVFVGGEDVSRPLREEEVTARVSEVAALPVVRDWLLDTQREAGREGRLVADGRDMGTVVFPNARTKVFLEADLNERARRRLRDKGIDRPSRSQIEEECALIERRDADDSSRAHSPLRPAEDAIRIDTTHLSFEDQVQAVVGLARSAAGDHGSTSPTPGPPR